MSWYENLDHHAQRVDTALRFTRNRPPALSRPARLDEVIDLSPAEEHRVTATHEAAHGLLFIAVGGIVEDITIHPVGSAEAAENKATTMFGSWGGGHWLGLAVALACGERAADRYLREAGLWTPGRAWGIERLAGDDRGRVARIVREVTGREMTYGQDDEPADFARICDHTDQVLDAHWPQVTALGRHLDRHGYVLGSDINRVVADAL